jgi:hypothetical protein
VNASASRLASVVLLIAACNSSVATCPEPDGVYLVQYRRVSGDCGDLDDRLRRYDPGAAMVSAPDEAPCEEVSREETADRCHTEYERRCDLEVDGEAVTLREVGSITVLDAAHAESVFEVDIRYASDGATYCRGVYDVTITRQ